MNTGTIATTDDALDLTPDELNDVLAELEPAKPALVSQAVSNALLHSCEDKWLEELFAENLRNIFPAKVEMRPHFDFDKVTYRYSMDLGVIMPKFYRIERGF